MNHSLFLASILLLLSFASCNDPVKKEFSGAVRIGITSEPDALNSVTYRTVNAQVINSLLFQKLMDVDYETLELVPVLAEAPPTIESKGDSLFILTYKIRPEATWDDGTAITAEDVLFTFKLALLPGLANEGKKGYLNGIQEITTDPEDPKSITFRCTPGMRMEYSTGAELGILPAHHYDPEALIKNISLKQLLHATPDSTATGNIAQWVEQFNSPAFQRKPEGIKGSGPYQLKSWVSDQRLKLSRKTEHWTDDVKSGPEYFNRFPEQITYFILSEPAAVISAARNGQIDSGPILRSGDYATLLSDSAFVNKFQVLLAPELSTNVILINSCLPELSTVKTRKALAHLFDTDQYIQTVQKSTGKRITGPLHPAKAEYAAQKTYAYNIEQAKNLLSEDGWTDSNNDGILDKLVDGRRVDLELEYKYNTGNEGRKNAGLMFKEWARPAGVEIKLVNEEWLVFIQSLMSKEFELAFFSWTDEHAPTDPAPVFHSASIDNGYNFGCFSHARADSLMDALAVTVDVENRIEIWRELQYILHDEVASIFLSTNDARFFVSKNFKAVEPSALTPGYWAGSFQLQEPH